MNLGGLGAAYGGFQKAENTQAVTEQNQAAAQEAAFKLLGAQVLGRALTGGQPQQGPQAPAPGQPSVPSAPPQQGNSPPMAQGDQPPAPTPQPAAGAPGAPPPASGGGMPEISLQALTARILQTSPGVRNHPQVLLAALERAAPLLDRASKDQLYELRQEMQRQSLDARERMVRMQQEGLNTRNAASTDARIYSADRGYEGRTYAADRGLEGRKYSADTLLQARELSTAARRDIAALSAQTRQEIADRAELGRNTRAELSATARAEIARLNGETRREVVGMMEAGRDRRSDQTSADRRYSTDARTNTAAEAEEGRRYATDRRADTAAAAEAGRANRAILSAETRQAMQRMSMAARQEIEDARQAGATNRAALSAETRRELATMGAVARREITEFVEEGRNTRAAAGQQGQNERAAARNERTDRRLDQNDTREGRLAVGAAVRQDQGYQRLEQQKEALAQRAISTGDKQALAQWRAAVDAQHKYAMERINANSIGSNLSKPDKAALLAEQNAAYKAAIADMRQRMASPTAPIGTTLPSEAPAPAGPPPAAGAQAPPASMLKPGGVNVMPDGSKWRLENGQVVAVP